MKYWILCVLSAFTLAVASGCGGGNLNREAVSGAVTLDGEPLPQGTIRFLPTAEGQSAGGKITAGKFTISQAEGPAPGVYRIEIVSYQSTGNQIPDPDSPGATKEELKQMIPAIYNRNSTLTETIVAGKENEFSFDLKTQ
jgi:hypothetical protein